MKYYNLSKITVNDYIKITDILKNKGIIVYPTETIYGIGGKGFDNEVIEKIFKIKKRPKDKNFLLLFKDFNMLEKYVVIKSDIEKKIIEKYWPGEVTMILNLKNSEGDIACRISSHPFVTMLFKYINFPIISTSANISGIDYNGSFKEIFELFKDKVDVIINSGDKYSAPSTIVKVVDNKLEIIRQGKVLLSV